MAQETQTKETEAGSTEGGLAVIPPVPAPEKKNVKRFTKKKLKLKKWIFLAVVLAAVGFGVYKYMNKGPGGMPVQTISLEKSDLVNTVNLTGTVESGDTANVYANTDGKIVKINVKVGDYVQAGEVLAQQDTEALQLQIKKQQATIEQKLKTSEFAQQLSEKDYVSGKIDLAAGLNQDIISAQSNLDKAQQDLNDARREYSDAKDEHEFGDEYVRRAQKDMDKAKDVRDKADKDFETFKQTADKNDPNYEEEYKKAEKAANDAEDAYREKQDKWYEVYNKYDDQLSDEAKNLHKARIDYQDALDRKAATKNAVDRELERLKDSIQKTELESDIAIDELELTSLQKSLSDASITAPISGTVTAVYAKEGSPASGMLFIIEDTDNLIVKTTVREYDVGAVKEGMETEIKADATGEQVFKGTIDKIYPTAKKDEKGETKTTGSIEFETDVGLKDKEGLRVGMNVRLNIVTAQKKDVFAVPFETVVTNPTGQAIVYTAVPDEEGNMTAKSIPVQTGMETSFYLEISGADIKDGMMLISDPTGLADGVPVLVPQMAPAGDAAADGTAGADTAMVAAG